MTVYLVWSNYHNAWWGPDNAGYRNDVWKAGRYSEQDALAACRGRSWEPGQPPPEVIVEAPESGRETFTVAEVAGLDRLIVERIKEANRRAIAERDARHARALHVMRSAGLEAPPGMKVRA